MSASGSLDITACKQGLIEVAKKGGALITGVADAQAFADAPEGYRPTDLLPGAKRVFVAGGAQPRAADWLSPNYQHFETSSFSDRIHSLGMRLARFTEDKYGYYAICVPPGVDAGGRPFISLELAAELAGCGSRSLAGPVLNEEYGFMYYTAVITTLPLEVDGPTHTPACPAPECLQMWEEHQTTPCMSVCPISDNGCIGGKIEDAKIVERRYDRARCTTRVESNWIPGFQKVLESTLNAPDKDNQKMMLYSSAFTRTLWSITYANASQGQCFECMRVCPVGQKHRIKK